MILWTMLPIGVTVLQPKAKSGWINRSGTLPIGTPLGEPSSRSGPGPLNTTELTTLSSLKKKEKAVGFFNLINAFIGAKIKLEYDAQTLAGEGAKEAEKLGGAAGLQKQLSGYQQMVKGMGQQMVKPSLEAFGAIEPLKSTNIDTLSIAFGVPKYKNGCALVIKIPGLSKVVSDLLA